MGFETIINQPLALKLIQRWLGKQTNQPLLFYGPAGVGKRAMAIEVAKALNCDSYKTDIPPFEKGGSGGIFSPGESQRQIPPNLPFSKGGVLQGCGVCLSCKKVAAGKHADVRVLDMAYQAIVRGEPLEKQQALRIETVLDERKRLYQTTTEGAWKVSILDDAHRMTPDAANVLLKVMEEPPPRTAIFLLTPYRDRLFATLISRCQPVRFRSLPEAEVLKRLTPDEKEDIHEAESLWEKLPAMTPSQILSTSDLPAGRQVRGSRTTTAASRIDVEAQLRALLSPALRDLRAGRLQSSDKVELIQKAQQQLRQNVPPNLVYDHLLLQLATSNKQ